ncbi:MAG: alpha-amylase [Citrobacter freundii]|nr:MAG: alpha-amylase [Citrobacter freundii]
MRKTLLALCFLLPAKPAVSQPEVIYHVFQRSFFDSNGDGNGDLTGIKQKLDYLQDLGVTSILLTPLYLSDFYHNYFANDFEKIDPAYGSLDDYLALVREVHRRKMKIYQDVEMQYVTGKHKWFLDSYKNPSSPYSKYLLYNDTRNESPYWFFGIPEFTTYDQSKEQIIVVNMKEEAVRDYTRKVLGYWIDPNGDGKFDDGVDGFRLDHAMDDLDNAGKLTNLFAGFWAPLLQSLRGKNPAISIVAEQADWGSFGMEYLTKAKVDRVFAFRLKHAIESFDKSKIMKAADSCFLHQSAQVVFIENHDTRRFATAVAHDPGKLRAGAAMNILLGGIPSLYYGQELGMSGTQLKGMTDGNDIPIREAFEWYRSASGPGMAFWYKNTGTWWDSSQVKPNDGISLEEQQSDKTSLFNYYKELIRLRKDNPALSEGQYRPVINKNANVLSFTRISGKQKLLVLINLSAASQTTSVDIKEKIKVTKIAGTSSFQQKPSGLDLDIQPYGYLIFQY